MGKWEMVRLGDVFSQSITGEWGADCENEPGTKVLRTTNFTNLGKIDFNNVVVRRIDGKKIEAKRLQFGDIILEKSGGSDNQPVGRVVYFEDDSDDIFLCNNFTQALRTSTSIANSKYVFYFMYYQHKIGVTELLQNKTTGIRNLQVKSYMDLKIILPSLPIQQKIADILDRASALIKKRKAQIEKLDLLVKSQFIEMFGDPVTNPKGWEIKNLGDAISVLTDYHANGSYEVLAQHVALLDAPDYALMIRTTDLENGNYTKNVKFISKEAYDFLEKSKVFGGEIIINKIGSAGKIYLMPKLNRPVSLAMNQFLLRFNNSYNTIYIYSFLETDYSKNNISKRVRGAVTKTITKEAVRDLLLLSPPLPFQNKFAVFVERVDEQKARLRKSLEMMELNYKSIMQKCFNGEMFKDEV